MRVCLLDINRVMSGFSHAHLDRYGGEERDTQGLETGRLTGAQEGRGEGGGGGQAERKG